MAMLWFYSDESYNSQAKVPPSFMVAGFLANDGVWEQIGAAWSAKNKRVGVSRFHAAHLNAKSHEFVGWTDQRSKRYVKSLLKILAKHGKKLHAITGGLLNDEYVVTISESGRTKYGVPFLVCFKHCIASIAHKMDGSNLPADLKFSVIFERNEWYKEAVEAFYVMKDDENFRKRHRLGTCAPGSWLEFVALEVADLIAYEAYRLLCQKRTGVRSSTEKPCKRCCLRTASLAAIWVRRSFKE